jgi:two-component system NtrC family sensor kinase
LNQVQCQECHGNKAVVAYLDVDTNLTQAERYFYTGSIHMIFLGLAIIMALFFGFYILFRNFINKPLISFRTALASVEKGNLDVNLPAKKNDEIGILEKHFNHMVKNLKDSKQKIDEMHFEQLQRADKLVTLGELAAQMAHEINNPAAIILSRADCVQMEAQKNNDLAKYDEDLQVIMNQVNKVSRITGNMLKYSRKLPKQFILVDLKQIVEESLHILEPRIIKNKITITKQFEVKNSTLQGDAHQLEQVVTNLINNALDAMTEGGKLKLIICLNEDHYLQLKINDNGSGIDDTTVEQIFTPFFTTKSGEKGTGLGLYIVKNICKNHNADIKCFSKPGEETTFTITFKEYKN